MTANSPQPPPQAARDAALIHGLAIFSAAFSASVIPFLTNDGEAKPVVIAMGGAATGTLLLWSLVLVGKAIRRGERSRWVGVVGALLSLEGSALVLGFLFAALLNMREGWFVSSGLAIFLPILVFAGILAVPLTWWLTRRATRREAAAGIAVPKPWRRALKRFCVATLLIYVFILPCPLFLFCACRSGAEPWWSGKSDRSWRGWVVDNTPATIADATSWLLSLGPRNVADRLQVGVLSTGRVSQRTLMAALNSKNAPICYAALHGLGRAAPQAALAYAIGVGDGTALSMAGVDVNVGWFLAQHGDRSQIARFLDPTKAPPPPPGFVEGILHQVAHAKRSDLVPELLRFCEGAPPNRSRGLSTLAQLVPPDDVERLWTTFLADSNPARRQESLNALRYLHNGGLSMRIITSALEAHGSTFTSELAERDAAGISHCDNWTATPQATPQVRTRFLKALLPMLDSDKLHERRAGAAFLAALVKATGTLRPAAKTIYWRSQEDRRMRKPLTETQADLDTVRQVREAARTWLDEQK